MQLVYADWAESLQSYTLGAINFAIGVSKQDAHPPNLGEFISYCKAYNPTNNVIKLESKFTPEQLEVNKKRIADILTTLRGKIAK